MDAPMDEATRSRDSAGMDRPLSVANAPHHRLVIEALSHLKALQPNGVWAALVDHQGQQIGAVGPMSGLDALGTLGNGLLSVSDSLVRLLGGPWANHVVVSAADRQIVILPASFGGVAALVIVAARQMPLGPLLWAARRCCAELGKTSDTLPTDFSSDPA